METATARTQLQTIIDDCDRTVRVLQGEGAHESSELSSTGQHPADHASEISEADREDALLEAATLRKLEAIGALARVEEGTYGTCVDCGNPIADERLSVLPEAARCAEDQAAFERRR